MSCPFCDPEVIKNHSIFESEHIYVLQNIHPANKGQCIVVPKRHITNIRQFTRDELLDLISTVQFISKKYKRGLKPKGFNYGFNEGSHAGQTIEHFHFHILPRFEGDKKHLPEYHLFHRNPVKKKNLPPKRMKSAVKEIRALFREDGSVS